MSDIVDRLRDRDAVVSSGLFYAFPAMRDAADEIDRLRAALQSIAKNTCCRGCQEAARVAKSALSPTDGAPEAPPKVRTQ